MKITVAQVIKKLKEDYKYDDMYSLSAYDDYIKDIVRDTISIIDKKLKAHKNITIKK